MLRACRLDEAPAGAPYGIALGLGALAAAGGWLNLLGIAYPPLLWALLAAGWIGAAFALRGAAAALPGARSSGSAAQLVFLAGAALCALLLAAALMPSASFNWDDDLLAYIPRPVRMLQAGTLGGNRFDSLGFDSLGSHAFLQAFTLLVFDGSSLNAWDAVFCAALALALVVSAARLLAARTATAAAALAGLALLHPIQLNISPVYASAALALALLPAAAPLGEAAAGRALWLRAAPAGLFIAALAGFKITSASFLAAAALAFMVLLAVARGWRSALHAGCAVAAWSALFLLPWLLLNAPAYARFASRAEPAAGAPFAGSAAELFGHGWSSTVTAYNAVAAFAAAALVAVLLVRRGREARGALPACVALCAGAALAYLANPFFFGVEPGIRHSVPALLAALPAAIFAAGWLADGAGRRAGAALAAAVVVALGLAFGPLMPERIERVKLRTIVSSPLEEGEPEKAGSAAVRTRAAQARTEPGERILALVSHPQYLYFARNPIDVASKLGVTLFWQERALEPEALRRRLRESGLRYVIWEPALWPEAQLERLLADPYPLDRRSALRMLSLRRSLAALAAASAARAADGIVVIDLR